jgi:hypothetical protein
MWSAQMTDQSSFSNGLPAEIIKLVRAGQLKQPFSRRDVESAIGRHAYSEHYLATVLPNNEIGGNYKTGYFKRVDVGFYKVSPTWLH